MSPTVDLKNVTISMVRPIQKYKHPAVLELSVVDHNNLLDIYTPVLFCYKPEKEGHSDAGRLAKTVKESLSKVLVPYFPFAGRLVRTFDTRTRELQCTDEGVPFIEAYVDEEMESVVNLTGFKSVELQGYRFLGLDPAAFQQNVDIPLPSVFIQMTEFKYGGVTINVSVAHQAADGHGMFAFMKAWSEIALDGKTSMAPSHDRSLFKSFFKSNIPAALSEMKFDSKKLLMGRNDPAAILRIPEEAIVPTSSKTLHVRREVIERLKREAADNGMQVSTGDLIAAHLWRSFSSVYQSIDNDSTTTIHFTVDGRTKLTSPTIPEHYSGNAFVSGRAPLIPASQLSTKSLLFTSSIVRGIVRSFDSSTWEAKMTPLFQTDDNLVAITSWCRFPLYDFNFGCGFGKPTFASYNCTPGLPKDVFVISHPPPPGLSKDSIATLFIIVERDNAALQAMLNSDQQFLSLFL